jgi:DNA relaxase NicK
MQKIADEGNQAKQAIRLGYKGVQCGKLFVGDSSQGLFILATGSVAAMAYEHLYLPEMHISRLDLQVTQWDCPNGAETGIIAEQHAVAYKRAAGSRHQRQIRHTSDDKGGYTLYIGSRSSDSFIRLYNKGKEAKDEYYKDSWRYEVEMHNTMASTSAAYLLAYKGTLEEAIVATVKAYARQRGLSVDWPSNDRLSILQPIPKEETDDIRSLRWLSAQVQPTVQRLIRAGYAADVAAALGIEVG